MTLLEALRRANGLRPNDIPDAVKAEWLYALEAEFAELQGVDMPENPFPEDAEMLMPFPYDNCYVLYLAAMIDDAHEEAALWQQDAQLANSAVRDAKAYWRRTHAPAGSAWKGLG